MRRAVQRSYLLHESAAGTAVPPHAVDVDVEGLGRINRDVERDALPFVDTDCGSVSSDLVDIFGGDLRTQLPTRAARLLIFDHNGIGSGKRPRAQLAYVKRGKNN